MKEQLFFVVETVFNWEILLFRPEFRNSTEFNKHFVYLKWQDNMLSMLFYLELFEIPGASG